MTTTASDTPLAADAVNQALHLAAARATLAPSIHNTQPWRFVVRSGRLDLYADRARSVPIIDPAGRQLAISCGAALFGARVALAAAQLEAVTALLPNPAEPDLLASITIAGLASGVVEAAHRLDRASGARHSNRRQFSSRPVPAEVCDAAAHAAEVEGAWLHEIRGLDDEVTVAMLSQRADASEHGDAAYLAELREWVTDDPDRSDGIPVSVIPRVNGAAHDDVPIREYDSLGAGELPAETHSRVGQTMFVLETAGDTMRDWLVAGQALQRVLLELTSAGFVATILSQVAEVSGPREQLRRDLRLAGQVQLLLRAGLAEPTPATPRRPISDVVT